MTNSDAPETEPPQRASDRHAFVKRWAAYVRTHDDAEWSKQQNTLIDAQLRSANELAATGQTDPVGFFERRDRRQRSDRE